MADELGLPKSSLQKAIKDALPGSMRIAGDASELLVQACNQFVHLISTQARWAVQGAGRQARHCASASLHRRAACSSARLGCRSGGPRSMHQADPTPSPPRPARLAPQANDISERDKRSTITPEHVIRALEELEFGPQYTGVARAGASF